MSMQSNLSVVESKEPQSKEIALAAENVTVTFRSYKERPTSLKESLLKRVKQGTAQHYSTFNALNNVSFEVPKGSVFGIIGSNGAGKSTLLKVLAGLLKPTAGSIKSVGSVDSLIQLGAGFDPDLNAIENIYLNSSLHRKSKKEIKERIPHIIEFAELEEFAETPIKYYSSGMSARLGFSVAIDRDPDIMIVDEVLGVGDERFQQKCKKRFQKLLEDKKTLIIVTHSMSFVENIAHEVALLSKGEIIFRGNPKEAVEVYRDPNYKTALATKT